MASAPAAFTRFSRLACMLALCAFIGTQLAPAQEGRRRRAPRRAGIEVVINGGQPIVAPPEAIVIRGAVEAPAGSNVLVAIDDERQAVMLREDGTFELRWPKVIAPGEYLVRVSVATPDGGTALVSHPLLVEAGAAAPAELPPPPAPAEEGRPPETPELEPPAAVAPERPDEPLAPRAAPLADSYRAYTDRWRLAAEPFGELELDYEIHSEPAPLDPYDQNLLKGDRPIIGDRVFLSLTGISDTLVEPRSAPIPSGLVTADPDGAAFFGDGDLLLARQNVLFQADLFKGDTTFRPVDWRLRATLIGNVNYLGAEENRVVNVDPLEGETRTDEFFAVEELFFERRLATLGASFDFVSLRLGSQPFTSDFRGFIFSDINLGIRLFGNARSNRYQYNVAYFDRLEKDTNSGLNKLESRDQQVFIANFFRQDLPIGHTLSASIHHVRDEAGFIFDENGFLARPDATGDFTPHELRATYLGLAGFGHAGRFNLDTALYYAFGEDELNPIAGSQLVATPGGGFTFLEEVDISAWQLTAEVSYDRNWYRPRLALFASSGDDDLNDRDATGFDAIFDNPNFAGGGFSLWNRASIPLTGTNVQLVNRGSLLPDLSSSKEEGQINFVNPGLLLGSLALDLELTPKLRSVLTANYLRFQTTEVLEGLLFQEAIDEEIGWDVSAGFRYRPYLNENVVLLSGAATLLPGKGYEDIYDDRALYQVFSTLTLTW